MALKLSNPRPGLTQNIRRLISGKNQGRKNEGTFIKERIKSGWLDPFAHGPVSFDSGRPRFLRETPAPYESGTDLLQEFSGLFEFRIQFQGLFQEENGFRVFVHLDQDLPGVKIQVLVVLGDRKGPLKIRGGFL